MRAKSRSTNIHENEAAHNSCKDSKYERMHALVWKTGWQEATDHLYPLRQHACQSRVALHVWDTVPRAQATVAHVAGALFTSPGSPGRGRCRPGCRLRRFGGRWWSAWCRSSGWAARRCLEFVAVWVGACAGTLGLAHIRCQLGVLDAVAKHGEAHAVGAATRFLSRLWLAVVAAVGVYGAGDAACVVGGHAEPLAVAAFGCAILLLVCVFAWVSVYMSVETLWAFPFIRMVPNTSHCARDSIVRWLNSIQSAAWYISINAERCMIHFYYSITSSHSKMFRIQRGSSSWLRASSAEEP